MGVWPSRMTAVRDPSRPVSPPRHFGPRLAALVLLMPWGTAAAQERIAIRQELCPRCTIEVSPKAVLEPEYVSGRPASVARAVDGRVLLADQYNRDWITVFDSSGSYIERYGAEGGGPGEFQRIALVIAGADHLHVFDYGNARHSRLSNSGAYLRSTPYYHVLLGSGVEVSPDVLVVNADIQTPGRIGLPLHRIGQDGSVQQSFGAELAVYRPDLPWLRMRALAAGQGGRVWSAHRTSYRMELWDTDGNLERVLTRDVDWFKPYQDWQPIDLSHPPRPWLQDIHLDAQNRLWIAVHVAGDGWERAFAPPAEPGGAPRLMDPPRLRDTVVEVVDAVGGGLIGSTIIPEMAVSFLSDGTLMTYRIDDHGIPLLEVWRLDIG